jgi:thiol-disulfide isomerase/thioredoxin
MRTLLALIIGLTLAAEARATPVPVIHGVDELKSTIEKAGAGGKPVIVHFFATWCGPCREEMPTLRKLIERAAKTGTPVLLFSLDEPKDAESKVPQFLKKHRIDAPTYVLDAPDSDVITKAIDPEWAAALPATFVFRGSARVKSILGPMANERVLDAVLK